MNIVERLNDPAQVAFVIIMAMGLIAGWLLKPLWASIGHTSTRPTNGNGAPLLDALAAVAKVTNESNTLFARNLDKIDAIGDDARDIVEELRKVNTSLNEVKIGQAEMTRALDRMAGALYNTGRSGH